MLYGRQVNSSKTTIQEIKVKKEIECNKKTYHEVKVEESSYIDKDYIEKFNKYIYCHWVVKSMKFFLVQRRKRNHK